MSDKAKKERADRRQAGRKLGQKIIGRLEGFLDTLRERLGSEDIVDEAGNRVEEPAPPKKGEE